MSQSEEQPTLSDGEIVLRPWRQEDVDDVVADHDSEMAWWFGWDEPSYTERSHRSIEEWRQDYAAGQRRAAFVIEHEDELIGSVEVTREGEYGGSLRWTLYARQRGRGHATRAVRILTDWALTVRELGGLGMQRVEARVDPRNEAALRVATRAGLRREGVQRLSPGMGEAPDTTEHVVLARLLDDPPLSDPESFRALLNSFLPRKRAIAQMLIRDRDDRVLLCQLTYKRDWDLPGGVVEVGESPHVAVAREVEEELGLSLAPGALLLTDWLPPWGGWDDALCLVFDGGIHDASVLEQVVKQEREILDVRFCTLEEVDELAADFTARRIRTVSGGGGPYTESGR